MGEKTGIAWTATVAPDGTVRPGSTANFWIGCQRTSPGCEHCYAERAATDRMRLQVWGPPATTMRHRTKGAWTDVPRWNRAAARDGVRRRVFVSSMCDVFEAHPQVAPWRAEALALLERCAALDVLLLTKRPQHVRAMVPPAWLEAWPRHVWIGTTVEDQRAADERIPHLLHVPAAVRFLSCEPLLEHVDLSLTRDGRIAWVIAGCESGAGRRPCSLEWVRSIVRQCDAAHVPAFVKQLAIDGRVSHAPAEWPEDLRRQEWPEVTHG